MTAVIAIIISVSDAERSGEFYRDLLGLEEVARDTGVIVLAKDLESPTVFLRQGTAHAIHPGHDAIGMRSLMFSVVDMAELDRVEERLKAWDGFRERHEALGLHNTAVVSGHDPDRNALAFLSTSTGAPVTVADVDSVPPIIYGIDL